LPRQDIDEEPGEGVVAPGPADLAGLFVDREIDAGALQRLGHEEPGDTGADDHNPKSPLSHHASPDPTTSTAKFMPPAADPATAHELPLREKITLK